MPNKTNEQIKAEVSAKIRRLYELGDVSGFIDYLDSIQENTLSAMHQGKNNDVEQNAFTDTITELLKNEKDARKGAKFLGDFGDESLKRKIAYIIKAGETLETFEEKIRNREIPEVEMYADDPKDVEKLAAIATVGSKAFNKIKNIDFMGIAMASVVADITGENSDLSDEYHKESENRPSVLEMGEQIWQNSGLSPEKIKKLRSNLEINSVDNNYYRNYDANSYYIEGSPVFQSIPKQAQNYISRTDDQVQIEVNELEQKIKLEDARNADTYVDFYDTAEKIAAIISIHSNLTIPTRTTIADDEQKELVEKFLKKPLAALTDKETIRNMTPAGYNKLVENTIGNIQSAFEMQKQNAENSKQIYELSKRSAELENVKNEDKKKSLINETSTQFYHSLADNAILGTFEFILEELNKWKKSLDKFYTDSVEQLKDEPFAKNIDTKRAEREKALADSKANLNTVELLKKKEELKRRKDAKALGEKLGNDLDSDVEYGDSTQFTYYAANALIEGKFPSGDVKADKAKKQAIDSFLGRLGKLSPIKDNNAKFITNLGNELKEREQKIKSSFDRRVKDLKADILAGNYPGINSASEEMAQALASDIVYHTTNEGRMLKAVHDTKKQVYGAINGSELWKIYLGSKPEIAKLYAVDDSMGSQAEKFGFKVNSDPTLTIMGTVFEKMPKVSEKLIMCDEKQLEAYRISTVNKLGDIDRFDMMIGNISAQAKRMLEQLNATKKNGHTDSDTYNAMVDDLKNLAQLDSGKMTIDGKLSDVTPDGVNKLLENMHTSAAAYQRAHEGLFKGVTKGFGRTRYNMSSFLQGFSKNSRKTLDGASGLIDGSTSIASQREQCRNTVKCIDDEALGRGYEQFIRGIPKQSPSAQLDDFILAAERENAGVKGSEQYGQALNAARTLKSAYEGGNLEKIRKAGNELKNKVNDYLTYKRGQMLDGNTPSSKGWSRIGRMNDLFLAGGAAIKHADNINAVNNDIKYGEDYISKLEQDKQSVLEQKAQEQKKINIANNAVNHNHLYTEEINQMKEDNELIYLNRSNDEKLKGLDKVSADVAMNAFNELSTKGGLEKLNPEDVLQAKENIAELVLDKMVQLDHGNVLHKNMKNIDQEQFKAQAKELSKSPEFNAVIPDTLSTEYINNILADREGLGVMQIKGNMEKVRKASKPVNNNAPANKAEHIIENNLKAIKP